MLSGQAYAVDIQTKHGCKALTNIMDGAVVGNIYRGGQTRDVGTWWHSQSGLARLMVRLNVYPDIAA